MQDHLNPQRFRVPREDRSLLSIPDLGTADRLVKENRKLFDQSRISLNGRTLIELRANARQDAVAYARAYTAKLLQAEIPDPGFQSCIVGGHQPELFHVGVWAKNFALANVAQRVQATAINLVIDNDTLHTTSVRIPSGPRSHLSIDRLPFDTPRPTLPWEEAAVLDEGLFRGFGKVIQQRLASAWNFRPLIGSSWPAAVQQFTWSNRLCDALTGLRAHVERSWGLTNLELPMSELCQTDSFLWFFAHLMGRSQELFHAYNNVVAEYRQVHRLRSRSQPVPDLESSDGWFESPFWVWRKGETQRGRLYVRRVGEFCELRHLEETFGRLPITEEGSLDAAVALLKELPSRGYRLRTRALTTTLFARLFLADTFVHGIGGAKYDAMTDRLCTLLFELPAPAFITVSATLYLPLGGTFPATEPDLQQINHRLRDLHYNPDRHVLQTPETATLIARKQDLLATAQTLRQSDQLQGNLTRDQHRQLAEIRAALQAHAGQQRSDYEAQRSAIRTQLAANALVRNREYAFVLYPEEQLRQFLAPLANLTEVKGA